MKLSTQNGYVVCWEFIMMKNINNSATKKYSGKMGLYLVLLSWIILSGGSLVGFLILDRNKYYVSYLFIKF